MPGLMAEGIHTDDAADASTDRSNQKQRRFRDSPALFLRFDLVDKHKQASQRIDYKKIDKQ